ncbi:MAG: cytochrome C oxidase subunit IV family protein [Roseiflexaceae bacterium]|mgnify:CR=1 FL=1|nr:cytochrome C oxidase subunit IV family protein [Roseiflexaceae bacterium]
MEMTHAHEEGAHSPRFYWIVGGVLAAITIVEVLITLIHLPHPLLVPILLVLSVIKGAGVIMFFMHLRGDRPPYQVMFLIPFTLAVTFILFFLLLFSQHVGIAG